MWDRAILKARAKTAISYNYWRCVLVSFVLILFVSSGSGVSSSTQNAININLNNPGMISDEGEVFSVLFAPRMAIFWGIISIVIVIMWILAIGLSFFVFLPMEIGGCRFFIENSYHTGEKTTSPGRLFYAFRSGSYMKSVGVMFLRQLYTVLWTLLFIIPGIVKTYEYRMIPYLLADCPELTREEVFRISKKMMDGQKLDAFVLDLSFIGWNILSVFTFGILNIFFVNPYVHATNAELFLELKKQYFAGKYEV